MNKIKPINWIYRKKIFNGSDHVNWAGMGTLTPCPVLLPNNILRVYCGFRDNSGISRIGFFDVDWLNDFTVTNFSKSPTLDIGNPGCFDDNGMLLGDFIWKDSKLYMYYVGFQIVQKAKFLAFCGIAHNSDAKFEKFSRVQENPILDRENNARYINAIHGITKINEDHFICYTSEGNGWEIINDAPYPQYQIFQRNTPDGFNFTNKSVCLNILKDKEYRVGRSRVISLSKDLHMLTFTYGTTDGKYLSGSAISTDLVNWNRDDDILNLLPSGDGFDSISAAYPALIKLPNGKTLCFYNGNNMGEGGIGIAVSESKYD